MAQRQRIVVVGGGLAGHRATLEILKAAPSAMVTMISAEHRHPYDRPPLSKEFLTSLGDHPSLPGADVYQDGRVTFLGFTMAVAIDKAARTVRTGDGTLHHFDKLLLATGSRPRRINGPDPAVPLLYLRTANDAASLRRRLEPGAKVLIIGGGFIGLEVAAAARAKECDVTVLDAQEVLLARAGSAELSHWAANYHRSRGIAVRLGAAVGGIRRSDNGQAVLETSVGEIAADAVVVGIGVIPNVELALEAGLKVDNGIVVDGYGRTSDVAIFAAGEVTSYPIEHLSIRLRSESWNVSGEQGAAVGRATAGDFSHPYDELPWLWSDQFEANVQLLGVPGLATSQSLFGSPSQSSWLLLGWGKEGDLVSAVAVNRGRDISLLRRALRKGSAIPAEFTSAPRVANAIRVPIGSDRSRVAP